MNKKIENLKSFYSRLTPPKNKSAQVAERVNNAIHNKTTKDPYLVPALFGLVILMIVSISLLKQPKAEMTLFRVESVISMENHTAIWLEPLSKENGS